MEGQDATSNQVSDVISVNWEILERCFSLLSSVSRYKAGFKLARWDEL
jgi:hypothetical protein